MARSGSRARNTELEKGARHTILAADNCMCLCGFVITEYHAKHCSWSVKWSVYWCRARLWLTFRGLTAIETYSRNTIPGVMKSHDIADLFWLAADRHMCIPNYRNLSDLIHIWPTWWYFLDFTSTSAKRCDYAVHCGAHGVGLLEPQPKRQSVYHQTTVFVSSRFTPTGTLWWPGQ